MLAGRVTKIMQVSWPPNFRELHGTRSEHAQNNGTATTLIQQSVTSKVKSGVQAVIKR
jgi:hypothetical protein